MAQSLLNVNIQPGGGSLFKRDGYGLFQSLTFSTSPVHGGFHFQQVGGNDVQLWGSDSGIYSSVNDAAFVRVSTNTLNATLQCADSQGFAYCLTSSRDTAVKTDGSSANTSFQGSIPLGTMLTFTPLQLVVSGVSGAESTLYISQQNAFTNFTIGVLPSSSFIEPIAAPGSRITHVAYYFGKLFWWKDQSFGYATFTNQNDWQLTIVSNQIGTLDNSDAFWNSSGFDSGAKFSGTAQANAGKSPGGIFFRGQDNHFYVYDGYYLTRLSRPITPSVTAANRKKANSWTQSTQSDFNNGSIQASSPTPTLSLTAIPDSILPSTASLADNSTNQFSAGSGSIGIDTTTIPGSVSLKTIFSDGFSDLSNWNVGSGASCTSPSVASGFLDFTGASTNLQTSSTIITTPEVVAQFQFKDTNTSPPDNETLGMGILTAGATAGYAIAIKGDNTTSKFILTLAELSSTGGGQGAWNSGALQSVGCNGSVATFSQSSTTINYDNNWHNLKIVRNSTTGATDMYVDGTLSVSATLTKFSSFTYVAFASNQAPGLGHWNVDASSVVVRTGNYTSRSFDTFFSTPVYGSFGTSQSNGNFSYATRCSVLPTSGFSSETVLSTGTNIQNCNGKRYLIYSSTISTVNTSPLPRLSSATLFFASTGTYYSAVNNAPNLTTWDTFSAIDGGDGTLSYFTRSSTNPFTVNSSTPAWVSQLKNSTIASSTGTYFQARIDFAITAATQTPTVNDFTFNWIEGSASDKAYISYFNDAIWFSVSASTNASTNNTIFYWDLLNGAWLVYDIPANGFLIENNSLYLGSPTQGKIFKFGGVTTDNALPINSYWRSKAFLGQDPFVQNELLQADFVLGQSSTTLNYTYTLDTSSSTVFSMSAFDASASLIQRNFLLPVGKIGKFYDFMIGDNSSNAAWRMMAHRLKYNALGWEPNQ